MSDLNQRYKGQDTQEVISYLVIITHLKNVFTYPHRIHTDPYRAPLIGGPQVW